MNWLRRFWDSIPDETPPRRREVLQAPTSFHQAEPVPTRQQIIAETEAASLTRLMDQFQAADEAGDFGECCQDPCPACTFGQWLDTKVAEAQSAATITTNPR